MPNVFRHEQSYHSIVVDRGIALHKMIRLITFSTSERYLNFMGNEFGHPEWIDFSTWRNNWSFKYARVNGNLQKNKDLKYNSLLRFDRKMLKLHTDFKILDDLTVKRIYENNADKVIVYMRGELLFVFNFHPTTPSRIMEYLSAGNSGCASTDWPLFGGFQQDRQERNLHLYTKKQKEIINAPLYLICTCLRNSSCILKKKLYGRLTDI